MTAKPVVLDEMAHPAVRSLIAKGMDMVILPVGAVEQHSLHLPLNVDYVLAYEIARGASALTGIPVLTPLAYGHSSNHRGFPGTFSLRPETFQRVVEELADWVYITGFRRLLFLNGNLPNQFPLQSAIANIGAKHDDFRLRTLNWWDTDDKTRSWFSGDESFGRCHANVAETALMLHLRPEQVDMKKTYLQPGRGNRPFFHYPHACVSRDGHQGDPSKATPQMGKDMFDHIVNTLAERLKAALVEKVPNPN